MSELCWSGAGYTRVSRRQWGTFGSRGVPCGDENAHGIPFEAIPLSPSHASWERKRKSCGATSEHKGTDAQIFGKKGNGVVRPPCHFPQLGEKGRWVVQPQQGKVPTRGYLVKKETVWRDLKICQIFFISLSTSTD